MGEQLFIDAAINGVVRKDDNPNVPRSEDEIVDDAIACFAAGASVVHPHEPDDAVSKVDADSYERVFSRVQDDVPGALLYPTVGQGGTWEERWGHIPELANRGVLHIGPIDAGSTNLGVLLPDGRPAPSDTVYDNSYAFIAHMIDLCWDHRLAPTFAIFEPTFLHTVVAYWNAGQLPPGAWLKFYMAGSGGYPGTGRNGMRPAPFGLPPTEKALDAYLEILGDCRCRGGCPRWAPTCSRAASPSSRSRAAGTCTWGSSRMPVRARPPTSSSSRRRWPSGDVTVENRSAPTRHSRGSVGEPPARRRARRVVSRP